MRACWRAGAARCSRQGSARGLGTAGRPAAGSRDVEVRRGVPAGTVEQQYGVSALGNRAGDLVEVRLHGLGDGARQSERCADAAGRTDGAEQVGALVALVGRLARSCSRLARWRTRPFFWPTRASSWNQTSIGVPRGRCAVWALSVAAKFFECRDGAPAKRVIAHSGRWGKSRWPATTRRARHLECCKQEAQPAYQAARQPFRLRTERDDGRVKPWSNEARKTGRGQT